MLSWTTVCVLSTTTQQDPEVQKMTSLTAHFVEPHRDVRREWLPSTWSPSNSTPHYNFNGKSTFFKEFILEKYTEVGQSSLSLSPSSLSLSPVDIVRDIRKPVSGGEAFVKRIWPAYPMNTPRLQLMAPEFLSYLCHQIQKKVQMSARLLIPILDIKMRSLGTQKIQSLILGEHININK